MLCMRFWLCCSVPWLWPFVSDDAHYKWVPVNPSKINWCYYNISYYMCIQQYLSRRCVHISDSLVFYCPQLHNYKYKTGRKALSSDCSVLDQHSSVIYMYIMIIITLFLLTPICIHVYNYATDMRKNSLLLDFNFGFENNAVVNNKPFSWISEVL